jgi:hypothetical protein
MYYKTTEELKAHGLMAKRHITDDAKKSPNRNYSNSIINEDELSADPFDYDKFKPNSKTMPKRVRTW